MRDEARGELHVHQAHRTAAEGEHQPRAVRRESGTWSSVFSAGRNVVALLQMAVAARLASGDAGTPVRDGVPLPRIGAAGRVRALAARPTNLLVFRSADVHDDVCAHLLSQLQVRLVAGSGSGE